MRRYVLPCVLVMAVSLGTAGLAYKAAAKKDFAANCSFQAVLSLSQGHPLSADATASYNKASAAMVVVARATDVFPEIARKQNVNADSVSNRTNVGAFGQGLGTFIANVSDADPKQAVTLANAVCDEFVLSIQKRRAAKVSADVKTVENRIAGFEAELGRLAAIPKKKRKTSDFAAALGLIAARKDNVQLLATILSLPPDEISVLTRATGARSRDKRSLPKNLVIALVAGLLGCFLIILVGETIAEGRKSEISKTG